MFCFALLAKHKGMHEIIRWQESLKDQHKNSYNLNNFVAKGMELPQDLYFVMADISYKKRIA